MTGLSDKKNYYSSPTGSTRLEFYTEEDVKEAVQNSEKEISEWNMKGEFKGFIRIDHVISIIKKHFGEKLI